MFYRYSPVLTDPELLNIPIRRSARARRLKLVARAGGIEAVAPLREAEHEIHAFILRNREWVERQQAMLDAQVALLPAQGFAQAIREGVLPLRGATVTLCVETVKRRGVVVEWDGAVRVRVPYRLMCSAAEPAVAAAVERWLRAQLVVEARRLIDQHTPHCGLAPRSLHARDQRRRWGSCGVYGDIYLNWRLIFAPLEVLEYVAVHELCHLRYRDHSRAFWALVAAHLPDYRDRQRVLRERGDAWLNWGVTPR